jgi:hypothetical protein
LLSACSFIVDGLAFFFSLFLIMHWFMKTSFVGWICYTNLCVHFYLIKCLFIIYYSFYSIFSCHLPSAQAGLRYLYSCRLAIFQRTHWSMNCIRLSIFHTFTIIITKLCRKQAKIIQNHGNAGIRNIGQGKP